MPAESVRDRRADVLALQRAENFGAMLLTDRDWALAQRASSRRVVDNRHKRAVELARAQATVAKKAFVPPPEPSAVDYETEFGEALAVAAFGIAIGFARGIRAIEDLCGLEPGAATS